MEPVQHACLRLMRLVGEGGGPDHATSVADARAAICLAGGVSPEDISPLGYDHSVRAYRDVRASWIRLIEMDGWSEQFDRPRLDEVTAVWQAARPELAAGDDWVGAAVAGHLARWHGPCRRGDSCHLCCRYRRWPMAEVPARPRGSGQVHCCGGHRERCLFGQQHRWSTWFRDGRLQRTTQTYHCDMCGGVCTAEEQEP
jgi:hypothetical protein